MTLPNFDLAKVAKFSDNVFMLAEQRQSYLRPLCKEVSVTGDRWQSISFGAVEAFEQTEYNQDAKYADVNTLNRWQFLRTFHLPVMRDEKQITESLLDIDGEFAKQISAGVARQIDRVVRDGILGSYWSGQYGNQEVQWTNTAVNFDAGTGNTLDISSGGISFGTLIDIETLFADRSYLDMPEDFVYVVITAKQQRQLLKELGSGSSAAKKEALSYDKNGNMISGSGKVKLITVPNAPTQGRAMANVESSKTQLFAFCKNSVEIGIQKDIQFEIVRKDGKYKSHVLQSSISLNSLRLDDAQVLKILA